MGIPTAQLSRRSVQLGHAREQAWRISQQHRNAFIRSRIISSKWGDGGHVRFGHSYSFAAGYVYILMATLAGICLAQLSHVKRAAGAVVAQR